MTFYYKLETMEAIDCPIEAMGISLVCTLDLDMENISMIQTSQQINRTPRRSVRFAEQLCTYKIIPSRNCSINQEPITEITEITKLPIVTEKSKIIIHKAKPNLTIQIPEDNISHPELDNDEDNDSDDDWFKKPKEEDDKENIEQQDILSQFLNCGWLKSVRAGWYEENVTRPMQADEQIYQMLETRKNSTTDPILFKKMDDKINKQRYNDLTRTLKTIQKGRRLFGLDDYEEIQRPRPRYKK